MSDRLFVIWSIEHDAWWAPERIGYTRELHEAGRYTQAEAAEIVKRANVVEFNEAAIPLECLVPLLSPRLVASLGLVSRIERLDPERREALIGLLEITERP